MKYVLINPLANNSKSEQVLEHVLNLVQGEVDVLKLTKINLQNFVSKLNKEDELIIVGGDGTLNNFINRLNGQMPENKIYLYPAGTGNDFLKDVGYTSGLFLINQYLVNLPKVTVKGKTSYFVNGIGFGIDGYSCEIGDKLRAESVENINYASIAVKGILFHFKKVTATIEVDGVVNTYKNVWLAPTMLGRYYGGGMKIAPSQDRLNEDRTLTNVIYNTRSKLKTLMSFPSIFKGEHVNKTKMVHIATGKKIKVTFSHPCALQIDGETVLNVTSYEVEA